jgi:NitT/TauT family transport system substrate-binding protein
MKKSYFRKIFITVSLLLAACTPAAQTTSLVAIKVQLGSTHQATYGGFYAADQNGMYTREGLTVSFILGGTNTDPTSPILDNTAQFGVMGASALISARAAGKPIHALAVIYRRDPVVFFSLANSGITHLQDFIGKKVFVSLQILPRLKAMLATAKINLDSINIVSTGDFTALYTGDVDVASGTITSTVLAARQAGHPVNIIYPDDYGVHFYSSTIYASDAYINSNPDLVTRFLRATMDGWASAIEDPQAIGAMVTHYNPKADTAFESASMVASIPYVNTGEDHIGWMDGDVWAGMLQTMQAEEEVTKPVTISDVYTVQFLKQIYGDNKS